MLCNLLGGNDQYVAITRYNLDSCTITCLLILTLIVKQPLSVLAEGGTYAIARVTFGSYVGFIVGCFEAFLNIIVLSQTVLPLGALYTYIFQTRVENEAWYWCIIMILPIITCCSEGKRFWLPISMFGAVSLSVLVIYILMSFRNVNFATYATCAHCSTSSNGGAYVWDFFVVLPFAMWPFAGVEFLPVCSGLVSEVIRFNMII
jgi:hypothetical protein